MKTRDYKLDSVKMILIILVIFAHIPLLGGLLNIGLPTDYSSVYMHTVMGIYAFHMPLFVLLSGYFTKRKSISKQFQSSKNLLRLFLIFQSVDLGIQVLSYQDIPSLYRCINPGFALWYLLCLFYWRILVCIIPQNIVPKIVIIISVAISLLVGFTPIRGEFGLHRFFSFMPYFMIGYYYGDKLQYMIKKILKIPSPPKAGGEIYYHFALWAFNCIFLI